MITTQGHSEILPEALYTLEDAKQRLGWGAHAFRVARRNGLVVKYASGRGYVRGADLIAYIFEQGKDEK